MKAPNFKKALARECTEIACTSGFAAPTWDNLPVKVMLAVTELNEAVAAVMGHGEDPLEEELADFAIRVLSLLDGVWGDTWNDRTGGRPLPENECLRRRLRPIEQQLWPLVRHCCGAVESWRHERRDDTLTFLELALKEVYILARVLDIDLPRHIILKMDKNRSRAHLHGKVRDEG